MSSEQQSPMPSQAAAPAALQAINILVASLWVATCAATPEFIWRGAKAVVHHLNWSDLASALLVGLILAFCVEPAMERFRHAWGSEKARSHGPRHYNLLFRAAVGLSFAFASVCLHDAITTFLASHAEDHAVRHAGLVAGLGLAGAWTVEPFCITLAWLTVGQHRLRVFCGLLAALSPGIAALVFAWSLQDWVATELPALCILALGYRYWPGGPVSRFFSRAVWALLWVCPIWLICALVVSWLGNLLGLHWTQVYTWSEAWIDARFYLGWAMGLLLAPVPLRERHSADNR